MNRMTKLSETLGFPLCNMSTVLEFGGEKPAIWDGFRIAPESSSVMANDPDDIQRDPCLKRLLRTTRPFTYDLDFYIQSSAADLWEKQAPFGYKNGIVSVIHMGGGRHMTLGFDRPEPLPICPEELIWVLADLQLATVFLQDKAFALFSVDGSPLPPPANLSKRQREVLQWASAGKTAWETGQILSISESAVNKIIARAAKTLHCNSKAQAIARAFQQGVL